METQPPPGSPASPSAPATPALSRMERREKAALDAVRALVKGYYEDQFGVRLPEEQDVGLALHIRTRPGENWTVAFDPPLQEQLAGQLQDYQAGRDVYQAGRVFCFRCDSSQCEHATAPSPRHVFRGYTSTGVAEWSELAQVLMDHKDERIDRLFEKRPAILALSQLGRDLKLNQLTSFGKASKTYAILGQAVAGYYTLPGSKSERLAVTFQIVETRGAEGRFELKLNAIADIQGDLSVTEHLASGWEPALARARDMTARDLTRLETRVIAAREAGRTEEARDALREIPALLRRFTESLERGFRQQARRTHHVEHRRQERRPVHKALDDGRNAAADKFFSDEKTGNIVICGPQSRAHVFNTSGRHVTSFALPPGGAEFRVRTHRWKPTPASGVAQFKKLLEREADGGLPVEEDASNERTTS